MSLITKISNPGPVAYYDSKFRNVFEDHLSFIVNKEPGSVSVVNIDPNTGARYAGDWKGLMTELSVYPQMHWYNLRLNGYTCSSDYDGSQLNISILDVSVVERLLASFRTVRKN